MAKTSLARSGQVVAAAFGGGHLVIVGTLLGTDESGVPLVDFPGNALGALVARIVGVLPAEVAQAGLAVALTFESGDRSRPLILGPVSDRLPEPAPTQPVVTTTNRREVFIDGNKVELSAESELVLRCGNASIVLRRDGKLVIKGTELVSRASGANKIRGGLVNIN